MVVYWKDKAECGSWPVWTLHQAVREIQLVSSVEQTTVEMSVIYSRIQCILLWEWKHYITFQSKDWHLQKITCTCISLIVWIDYNMIYMYISYSCLSVLGVKRLFYIGWRWITWIQLFVCVFKVCDSCVISVWNIIRHELVLCFEHIICNSNGDMYKLGISMRGFRNFKNLPFYYMFQLIHSTAMLFTETQKEPKQKTTNCFFWVMSSTENCTIHHNHQK